MSASATTMMSTGAGGAAFLVRFVAQLPRWLWIACVAQVALLTGATARWIASGDSEGAARFLQHQGSYMLLAFAAAEYLMAVAAWRLFERGHPMRTAWLFLMGASGCRLLDLVATNLFGGLVSAGSGATWNAGVSLGTVIRGYGQTVANPLSLLLLAAGLSVVLRLYKAAGLLRKLNLLDSALLVAVCVLLGLRLYLLALWPAAAAVSKTAIYDLAWVTGPLLAVLVVQAMRIRRSPLNEDGGLIGRAWGAYAVAILLTCFGEIVGVPAGSGSAAWHYVYLTSCGWALAGLACALGPAYQVEAILRARNPWLRRP